MRIGALIFTLLLIPVLFTLQVIVMHKSKEDNNEIRVEMERAERREGQGRGP